MKVVIVEDERPAAERLQMALAAHDPQIDVIAHLQTVAETVQWFDSHPSPDLVFLDVRLTDGLSLEVFRETRVDCPVVFTTAFDAYVLDAFECNSIDYLLKPVKAERLAQAIRKYEQLRRHFAADLAESLRRAFDKNGRSYKRRIVVQRGTAYVSLETMEIRYAFSSEKTTFVVSQDGTQYLCDDALTSLEEMLDPSCFFRLNRKYLARIDGIASFRPASRGRIRVDLDPVSGETVLVSQEKAGRFKNWIDG